MAFGESIRKGYESGGSLALLGDLHLEDESLFVTNWDAHIRYTDAIDGATKNYQPCPFILAEDAIIRSADQTTMLRIFMGIVGQTQFDESDEFTASQEANFTEAMADLEEYLDRNDIRGSLAILRIINPNDPTEAEEIFTGIVDSWTISDTGINLDIAEANDIIDAPAHPISTMCPYTFGSVDCQANRDSAANKYVGAATSGSTATTIIDTSVTNATDNYWKPGSIKITSGENKGAVRAVKSFDGSATSVTVVVPFTFNVAVGDGIELRRDCAHTREYCDQVHSNLVNFGGYERASETLQGLFFRGK